MMHTIYSQAKEVLVWLGEEATRSTIPDDRSEISYQNKFRTTRQAFEYLSNYLCCEKNMEQVRAATPGRPDIDALAQGFFKDIFGSPSSWQAWNALHDVLIREYWWRAWIFQEIALARKVLLFCGSQHLPGEAFQLIYLLIEGRYSLSEDELSPYPGYDGPFPITGIGEPVHYRSLANQRWHRRNRPLEELLEHYANSHCYDKHDIIYALLGLASDHYKGHYFPVNYNDTFVDLLTKTLIFCRSKKSLSLAQKIVKIFDMGPSWGLAGLSDMVSWANAFASLWAAGVSANVLQESMTIELTSLGCVKNQCSAEGGFVAGDSRLTPLSGLGEVHCGDLAFKIEPVLLCLLYRPTEQGLEPTGAALNSRDEDLSVSEEVVISLYAIYGRHIVSDALPMENYRAVDSDTTVLATIRLRGLLEILTVEPEMPFKRKTSRENPRYTDR